MNKRALIKTVVGISVALILLCVVFFSLLYSDYLELLEIGENFIKVFTTNISVYAITFVINLIVCFAIMYSDLLVVRSNAMHIDTTVTMFTKKSVIILISIVFALSASYITSSQISNAFLPFINSEWFSLGDPIFNQDVGYYVFQRPFYITIINALSYLTGFLILINCLSYFFIYAGYDLRNIKKIINEKGISTHIIVSVVMFFLVKAVTYQFTADSIIFKQHNGITGANYTDITVWLKFYRLAPVILLFSVIVAIIFILRSKLNFAILSVCIYPAAFILVSILSGIVDTAVVQPNELSVSSRFIQYNIDFTRSAYQLDNIGQSEFSIRSNLTADSILKNIKTVNNIKLIDYDKTLGYLNETQNIEQRYTFTDLDTSLYDIGGVPTTVAISAREIDTSKINGGNLTYEEKRYKYTHGVGAVMCPDNSITSLGLPQPVIRDNPPRSSNDAPAVTEPRIYYGEINSDYCIVGTKEKEHDEITNEGYDYNGNGGIILNFVNKLIYSIKLGDAKILFSKQLQKQSKLLLNRNIIDRVNSAAPFFTYDKDPYLLIDKAGRLKWIIDVYTTSKWYPYSQYSGKYNYIRNSAKAVVDAYGGTVQFYITDENDPIIKCYKKIYPTLFEQSAFPSDLITHIKYPEALFKVQANFYKTYHVINAEDFYKGKDIWTFTKERYNLEQHVESEPRYMYINVNGIGNRLMLMIPYSLANKDSMIGWLAVDCGYDNYGKATYFDLSQNETSFGTLQIENRIDAAQNVNENLSLINQGKGKLLRGNMIILPIENNLLYIKPIYLSVDSEKNNYAELKTIVVVYNDKIVCGDTLSVCFKQLFGINRQLSTVVDQTIDDIISDVLKSFDDVKQYSGKNDWENYGKAMNELEYNIGNLRSVAKNGSENDN